MFVLRIDYVIDPEMVDDFVIYGSKWRGILPTLGVDLVGYFAPTKIAGSDNIALALIRFQDMTQYEMFRENIKDSTESLENLRFAKERGFILSETRSFMRIC